MRLNSLRMNDELEINTSMEKFKDECKNDKTTYSFIRSLNDGYIRKPSTDQKVIAFGKDMLTSCIIMIMILILGIILEINPVVEIMWRTCMTMLTIFCILCSISMCIRYLNDAKNLFEFYTKSSLSVTTGETIGLIKSSYNREIPIVKYEIDDKVYISCPDTHTKNNKIESKVIIIYDDNNPHKFLIKDSSYHQQVLMTELVICMCYIIATSIILIL